MPLVLLLLLFSLQNPVSAEEYQCPCPEVGVIDQAGIQNLQYGSYLANRSTTAPKVTVTRNCEIFADVTGLDIDNHLLMAFREGAPPIFAARLTSSSKTIQLLNIQCIKNGCDHEWQYYNGTVNNLTLAVQQDEPRCNCDFSQITPGYNGYSMWLEANMTTCDELVFNCTDNQSAGWYRYDGMASIFYEKKPNGMVVDDLTCVSGTWWYNGFPTKELRPRCYDWNLEVSDCGCVEMIQYGVYPEPDSLDFNGQFANWTLKSGSAVYNGCSADLKCSGTDTLVIFSANYKPMIYSPEKSPIITCANSPMSTSPNSPKFWFVDGIMLSDAHFGCYAHTCPCKFAFMSASNIAKFVGNHPDLEKLADYIIAPIEKYSDGDCPDRLVCTDASLVNFDVSNASYIGAQSTSDVTCSNSKWTVEGKQYDQLYVTCSMFK